jgi:hypothetical protein
MNTLNPCRRLARFAIVTFVAVLLAGVPFSAQAAKLKALNKDGKLEGWFALIETHASILSDAAEKALLAGTFGYGLRAGYRWDGWGLFLHLEQNLWLSTEIETDVVYGAFNIGIGGEYTYKNGFLRTTFSIGPSILAFDTALDPAGTTGFFFDLRPVGLRWTVHEHLVVGFDPIAFALVVPVLGGIPLIQAEYRTIVYLEGVF